MVRPRKLDAVDLPKLAPHWHPPGCDCEWAQPYIRVSRVGSREMVISPELQLRAQETYARTHKLRLREPVCDINRSGRTFRKRSVDKIISEIQHGQYRRVLLWKWSRWARNTEESAKYLKYVRDAGGRVDSATEDFDQDTAIGKLQLGIMREFDQYTSNVMSETWHGVHARRREAGLPHGGRARFGYDYVDVRDENGKLIEKKYKINEAQAEVLKAAYVLYNNGTSYNKLLVHFLNSGFTTTLDGTWTPQSIARMMDTGFAAGLIRERSAPTDKPSNSILDYDVWRPGSHESIIDQKTWLAYKKRRISMANLPPRSRKARHALSALLYCAVCRRRLVTKYAGAGRTHQWQCPWQKALHSGVAVTVNNRMTLIAVRDWVRDQFGESHPVEEYTERMRRLADLEEQESRTDQVKIEQQIAALEGKIENLVELAATAPERAKERYNTKIESWDREIEELRTRLTPVVTKERAEKDYNALRKLDEIWEELSAEFLREALSKMISRIEVSPRTAESSRRTAADRVNPVGVWEEPAIEDWLAERSA